MAWSARPAAGRDEVLAGIAVRHEAYARKLPLLAVQAQRLGSRREHRAVPWVLDRGGGTIVSTLLCHPIELELDGRVMPAYGLGSVGTRVADRRRGYAAALCAAACEANEAAGRRVGLLYSDIAPAYYERLAFATSPAWVGRCERLPDLVATAKAATPVRLDPVDPRRDLDHLCSLWRTVHRGMLHPHRDAARFLESVEDTADDWFFAVRGRGEGYLRLAAGSGAALEIVESVLGDPADEAGALCAAAQIALGAGKQALAGWMAPTDFVREWFAPTLRTDAIPMLRGAPPHAAARFWEADHF